MSFKRPRGEWIKVRRVPCVGPNTEADCVGDGVIESRPASKPHYRCHACAAARHHAQTRKLFELRQRVIH